MGILLLLLLVSNPYTSEDGRDLTEWSNGSTTEDQAACAN